MLRQSLNWSKKKNLYICKRQENCVEALGTFLVACWVNGTMPVNMRKHINTHKTHTEKPTRKSQGLARIIPQSVVSFFLVVIYEFSPLTVIVTNDVNQFQKSDHVENSTMSKSQGSKEQMPHSQSQHGSPHNVWLSTQLQILRIIVPEVAFRFLLLFFPFEKLWFFFWLQNLTKRQRLFLVFFMSFYIYELR